MAGLDYYGDKFKWFVGVCKEISSDGTKIKVRIFGIHRMDDVTDVSDGDLPEAVVLKPTTAGEGSNSTLSMGIKEGDMVVGFFADGDDCQQPVVIGVVPSGQYSDATYNPNDPDSSNGGDGGGDGGGGGDDGGGDGVDYGDGDDQRVKITPDTDYAYNFLRSQFESWSGNNGNPHFQAVALMGHISAESEWRRTVENWEGESSLGYLQWNGPRRTNLLNHRNPFSKETQLSLIFEELNTSQYTTARNRILNANTREAAVRAWSLFIIHCGVKNGELNEDICNNGDPDPESACHGKSGRCTRRFGAAKSFDEHYADKYEGPPAGDR